MSGGGMMPTVWIPTCGQSWIGAAASFLVMWVVMMTAMMVPSLIPVLWRYRQSAGRAGAMAPALLIPGVVVGYFLVWTLAGAAVSPFDIAIKAATMRYTALAHAAPIAIGLVVVAAGALQLTRWKAHHLACCRADHANESLGRAGASSETVITAVHYGLRAGIHCVQCCAGLTAALLAIGIMDAPVMIAATIGITLERLAPAGERVARAIGVVVTGAGLFLTLRAAAIA